jgi:hypothetical protein
MTEEQMNRLELIVKNWINHGAQCNTSVKVYTRSLYPTYNPGIRTRKRYSKLRTSKTHQKPMIQLCEDFLRKNRKLLKL